MKIEPHYGDDARLPPRDVWAILDRDGTLRFIDTAQSESQIWSIWLGWPAANEIKEAKDRGFHAVLVDVVERKAG